MESLGKGTADKTWSCWFEYGNLYLAVLPDNLKIWRTCIREMSGYQNFLFFPHRFYSISDKSFDFAENAIAFFTCLVQFGLQLHNPLE